MSEYCNKENIKLNPNIWNDLNNIEVLENWLMLLDRMELFTRSEEKNAELKSQKSDYGIKLKTLMSANIEKQSKALKLENMTLREELEKYREILIKLQNTQKLNQHLSADKEINFLVKEFEEEDYNVLPELDKIDPKKLDLTDMMSHRDSILNSEIKTE